MNLPETVDSLLQINLEQVAAKFGLIDSKRTLSTSHAVKLLNLAEQHSFQPTNEERTFSLVLCALVWENRQESWRSLGPFIGRILIRLGLGTSARMVNWNLDYDCFDSLGSIVDDLSSTLKLIDHEVIINGHKLVLSDFQKRMWDSIEGYSHVGVSAPTSAGKSFVLVNKSIELLLKDDGKVVFIVPTVSLINQVCNDLRKTIRGYGISNIQVSQTVNDITLFKSNKLILVLTQERAFSALNHPDSEFKNIKMLIVDEIQNIEKVSNEDDERSRILLDVIQTFKNDLQPGKIILSGPRLENISELMINWFGDDGKSVTETLPSVVNITYSFKAQGKKILFQQYVLPGVCHSIEIEDKFQLRKKILAKVRYSEEANSFIATLIARNRNEGNIIFSDTTSNANLIAREIANRLEAQTESAEDTSIKQFIEETVHPQYELINTIKKGVAYHHGKMPAHIRCLVEKLFATKRISTVVSTTTLMQGVNLPAKNIIIRNPKVANDSLTGYEFTNLKGRAGRLMKDFVGRAIIIDESFCNKSSIDLKTTEQKSLIMGFGERYQNEKDLIDAVLLGSPMPRELSHHDLVIYIRNMCIKYGNDALERIKEVGIHLNDYIFKKTLEAIAELSLPRTISLNNFYWDPILLNSIYISFLNNEWPAVPTVVYDSVYSLCQLIFKLHTDARYYCDRYLKIDLDSEFGQKKLLSLCIYAESFAKGRPLREVINPLNFPVQSSEDIDARINDLHTKVVFGIPKLLKPIFNIHDFINKATSSQVLNFIEVGAVNPKMRALIEIGVPRETAIVLLDIIPGIDFLGPDGAISENGLETFMRAVRSNNLISPWHKLLIQDI
jgi:hypothetical protein